MRHTIVFHTGRMTEFPNRSSAIRSIGFVQTDSSQGSLNRFFQLLENEAGRMGKPVIMEFGDKISGETRDLIIHDRDLTEQDFHDMELPLPSNFGE